MWTDTRHTQIGPASTVGATTRRSERGYTLVALLALMTVMALFAMAAAPSIHQQSLRERELEAIRRGEEVADAIRLYYSYQQLKGLSGDAALPTSIDQLVEGVTIGSKKLQILRPSAAHDPLSASGEWRLVKPRSNELADFQRSVMLFAGNVRPPTNDPQLKRVELLMAPAVLATIDIASSGSSSSADDNSSGPFIGVASSNKTESVLTYYGIERHDEWIFTPLFR
jgi:type II secretory pathway pseudopilin PulG